MRGTYERDSRTTETGLRPLSETELAQTDGGVAPIYTEDGGVITCTDPRRWTYPILTISPFLRF